MRKLAFSAYLTERAQKCADMFFLFLFFAKNFYLLRTKFIDDVMKKGEEWLLKKGPVICLTMCVKFTLKSLHYDTLMEGLFE
jgi:hypothetical protein